MKELIIGDLNTEKRVFVDLLQEKIQEIKFINFEISGTSMYPYLKVGDKVLVKHISPEELKFGDIVTYRINNGFYSHRFIYKLKKRGSVSGIITKGDNAPDFDSPIMPSQILGRIITIERKNVKINLEDRQVWQLINRIIASLSFFQGSLMKYFRYFKNAFFKGSLGLPLKHIAAFPFAALLRCVTGSICFINARFSKNKPR